MTDSTYVTTKQMHAKSIDVLARCAEHVDDNLRAEIKAAVTEWCDTNNSVVIESGNKIDFINKDDL